MTLESPYGAAFTEFYRGRLLYNGLFDNKDNVLSLAQSSNSSAGSNETAAQEKRALNTHSLDVMNSSTTSLTIPGSDDVEYRIDFDFRGDRIGKIAIFSAILEFMMTLAQLNSVDPIEDVSQANATDLSWIFVMHNSESGIPLQGFQLLAILEAIARHSVNQVCYREMTFGFFVDGQTVAEGCVTKPELSRAWCRELRGGGSGIDRRIAPLSHTV